MDQFEKESFGAKRPSAECLLNAANHYYTFGSRSTTPETRTKSTMPPPLFSHSASTL